MSPTILPLARRQPDGMLRGHHVLIAVVAFFGVIFAVNAVLVWQAVATHSGLVASEPYRKGLGYNRRIEADERQQALGWTSEAAVDPGSAIAVTLAGPDGQPVSGLSLSGAIGRPSTGRSDVALRFVEHAPGRYVALLGGLEAGAWLLSVEAHAGSPAAGGATDGPVYRLKRRLWLKP